MCMSIPSPWAYIQWIHLSGCYQGTEKDKHTCDCWCLLEQTCWGTELRWVQPLSDSSVGSRESKDGRKEGEMQKVNREKLERKWAWTLASRTRGGGWGQKRQRANYKEKCKVVQGDRGESDKQQPQIWSWPLWANRLHQRLLLIFSPALPL